MEARALVEEAERSLNTDGVGDIDAITEKERKAIIKNEERLESIKAASISAIVGTLAGLPFSLAQVTSSSQLILPSAVTFIGCALFGVTFRYIIRRDLDNIHLKTGGAATFGVIKGTLIFLLMNWMNALHVLTIILHLEKVEHIITMKQIVLIKTWDLGSVACRAVNKLN